jgi:lysozyme
MGRLLASIGFGCFGCFVGACTGVEESEQSSALTSQCATDTVEGVDVYSGTGVIDWTKVKASGRQFAFIKATQGDYNKQSTFVTQWSGALAAGILRSPYHFFDATSDGTAQATWFLDELTAAGGLQPGDLPPLLDLECPTSSSQSQTEANCEYTGDSGWVDNATLIQRTFDWLTAVQAATGRTPIIYSYPSWFAGVAFTDPRLASFPLFIASYNTCASVPAPWTSAVFWQYSASTVVSGIAAKADVDRFFGTAAELGGLTNPPPDAGVPADASVDPDAAMPPAAEKGSSGCAAGGTPPLWLALLVLALRRRRA